MSLAEKLAALTNPEPEFGDPEKEHDLTAAKVTEYEQDVDDTNYLSVDNEKSKLRVKNADLAEDARYKGKKVSRSALAKQRGSDLTDDDPDAREHAAAELGYLFQTELGGDESDESSDSEDDQSDAGPSQQEVAAVGEESDELEEESSWIVEKDDQEAEDFAQYGGIDSGDDSSDDLSDDSSEDKNEEMGIKNRTGEHAEVLNDGNADHEYVSKESLLAEVSKGKAVQRQLTVWDKLLEVRIHQQKFLSKVNSLPVGEYWNTLTSSDSQVHEQVKQTRQTLTNLLRDLIDLQCVLSESSHDVELSEPAPKKKKLSDFSQTLADSHTTFMAERNTIIQKWNDKTRITSGKNSFSSLETSTVDQIELILRNKDRLIDRTKLKRSNYAILGSNSNLLEHSEINQKHMDIFDDDDFYQQLLRDLIERKTNSSSDQAQLTRQWLEVQKLRTKLKKKVDTKASKGRKVRYDIHAKLINFMAPIHAQAENEETKNELFSSLFGARR